MVAQRKEKQQGGKQKQRSDGTRHGVQATERGGNPEHTSAMLNNS